MGLDLQSLMLVNTQSLATHQRLKIDGNNAIYQIPQTFDSQAMSYILATYNATEWTSCD